MTDKEKIEALTELLGNVMFTLEMKQYAIEDPNKSYQCVTEADRYHQEMLDILHSDVSKVEVSQ